MMADDKKSKDPIEVKRPSTRDAELDKHQPGHSKKCVCVAFEL